MERNIIFALALSFIFLAGCIGLDEFSSAPAYEGEMDRASYESLTPSAQGYTEPDKVIKTASVDIEVPSGTIEQKYTALKDVLDEHGAEVSSVSFYEYSDEKVYHVSVKVPPQNLDALVDSVKVMGKLRNVDTSLRDVTQEYRDLELRIRHKEIQLARLYELYNKSDKVEDLLGVEEHVTRVEYELESFKQQKQYYDERIDRSSVTIRLSEKKSPVESELIVPLEGLLAIFLAALAFGTTLLVGLAGLLIPVAIAILAIKFAWDFFGKRRRKKKKLNEV